MDQIINYQITLAAVVTALVALISAVINNWQASKTARTIATLNEQQHKQRLEFEKNRAANELELGKMRVEYEKLRANNELAAEDRRHKESLELESSRMKLELAVKLTIEEFEKLYAEAEKEHACELDDMKRSGMYDSVMELPRVSYPRINQVFQRNLKLVQQKSEQG